MPTFFGSFMSESRSVCPDSEPVHEDIHMFGKLIGTKCAESVVTSELAILAQSP